MFVYIICFALRLIVDCILANILMVDCFNCVITHFLFRSLVFDQSIVFLFFGVIVIFMYVIGLFGGILHTVCNRYVG